MSSQWIVFKALCKRDFFVLRSTLASDLIDAGILVFLQLVNYVYFLPLMGMKAQLIAPLFVGGVGSFCINAAFDRGIDDSADIAFAQFIKYQITLPLSLTWLFFQKISMHMVSLALVSLPSVGVLLFFVRHAMTAQGLILFLLLYLCALLWVAALIIAVAYGTTFFWFIDNIWTRVLMPIMFLGCQYFPFKAVYALSPWLAAVYALSPLTYMIEGMRAALLGGDQFLPVGLCSVVLVLISIITILISRRIFIRRLYA